MRRQPMFGRVALIGALLTALFLVGGLSLGLALAFSVNGLVMHVPDLGRNLVSALIVLAILALSGFGWGWTMARLTGWEDSRRLGWAGLLSIGPAVVLAGVVLNLLGVAAVGGDPGLPIHIAFIFFFVPAVFLVAGLPALAFGVALRDGRLAGQLFWQTGLSAALAFLVVAVAMDLIGWRVGAPGAAQRNTMLTVMLVSNLAAALAGGGLLGYALVRAR